MSNLNVKHINGSDTDIGKLKVFVESTTMVVHTSMNVSSMIDHGTGLGKQFNFTNCMIDANYPVNHWAKMAGGGYGAPWENNGWKLSGSYRISYNNHASTVISNGEAAINNIVVYGDLA